MTLQQINPKDRVKLVALIVAALGFFGFSISQMATYDIAQQEMVAKARAAAASNMAARSQPAPPSAAPAVPVASVPGA